MTTVVELAVRPLGVIGAEVCDISLAGAGNAEIEAIKRAWYRHDVLVFRNPRRPRLTRARSRMR